MFKKNKVVVGIVLLIGIFAEVFVVYGMQVTHLHKEDKKTRELRQQIEAYDRDAVRVP